MKLRIFFTIITLTLMASSAKASSVIEAADSAYSTSDYQKAAELYTKALADEGLSPQLYYNLGNAYYRLNRPGLAILNYHRALRLDPTYKDARENLEFVNSRITDRPGERGTFLGNAIDSAASAARSDTWTWIAFGAFAATCALVALYVFSSTVSYRKAGFFGGLAMLVITGIALFLAIRGASIQTDTTMAVVTEPSTILSTSPREPRDRSEEAMLLHEGTALKILDSVRSVTDSVPGMWYDVEIDNQHRAWINSRHAERVR